MRIRSLVALSLSLLFATALHAQDAAVEDITSGADAAVAEDATPPEDAAQTVDAGAIEDAASVADAAVGTDAAAAEDATTGTDAGTATDANVTADSGTEDATTGPGCAEVSFWGECDGDTVRYCASDNQIIEIDCVAEYGSDATCGLADCTDGDDCLGYFCVARSGSACDQLGCDVGAGEGCLGGTCQSSTTCEPSAYTPSCDGDQVTYCAFTVSDSDCSEGATQPYTCGQGPNNSSACIGTAGGLCNIETGHGCADGLDCMGGVCAEPGSDAGVLDTGAAGDASINPPKEEPGCGCAVQNAAGAGSLLLLLGLIALSLRRRR